ncbi:MAG TPA: dTDP-4-dehydrorhamnose 3,5-epimerase [Chitinophagaceae bacterium]|nr:dTDP-4-dehydrorhamnose 3,5-epimerase [Chitinophagaceae bacterium]
MNFTETKLPGAYIIDINKLEDDRGFFARTFCKKEFAIFGLNTDICQCNISYNQKKSTLRGMHMQLAPYEEAKIIRCSRGAVYDVIVDMRINSNTFKQWISVELDELNRRMLYVPEGFAHGFMTLADDTEVIYEITQFYKQGFEAGYRWDDPVLNIKWPASPVVISQKDSSYSLIAS